MFGLCIMTYSRFGITLMLVTGCSKCTLCGECIQVVGKPFSRIVTIGLMLETQDLGFSYMNSFTLLRVSTQ